MNDDLKTELERVKQQLDAANRREELLNIRLQPIAAIVSKVPSWSANSLPLEDWKGATEQLWRDVKAALQPDAGKEQP